MFGKELADFLVPRRFKVEILFRPAVELGVPTEQVRLEQRHAAADIPADEVRVDFALRHERCPNRRAFSRVQIRKAHRATDTVEFGRGIQLAHRFAFNPAFGRGEKAHLSFSQCVHVSFEPAKAGWLWLVPEVGIAPTSRLFQSRANLSQLLGGRSSPSVDWSSWQVTLLRLPVISQALCF